MTRPTAALIAADTPTVELNLTDTHLIHRLFDAFHKMPERTRHQVVVAAKIPPGTDLHTRSVAAIAANVHVQAALCVLLDPAECEDLRSELGEYASWDPLEREVTG